MIDRVDLCTRPGDRRTVLCRRGLKQRRWASGGFTIVEVSIAAFITVIFLLGLWRLFGSASRLFRKSDASLEATQSATILMTVLTEDLRNLTVPLDRLGFTPPGATPAGGNFWYVHLDGPDKVAFDKETLVLDQAGQSFEIYVTAPELETVAASGKEAAGANRPTIRKVTYKLEEPYPGKKIYQLVREETGGKPQRFRESHVLELRIRFARMLANDPKSTTPAKDGDPALYFAQILIVGASTSRVEKGNPPTIKADAPYYNVPLVSLVHLDQLTEVFSGRGLSRHFNLLPDLVAPPAP